MLDKKTSLCSETILWTARRVEFCGFCSETIVQRIDRGRRRRCGLKDKNRRQFNS